MVEASAHGLDLHEDHKSLLNYWFRHVWELVWPLFPGFILFSSLAGLSPGQVIAHTWPAVPAALLVGWYRFLRRVPEIPHSVVSETGKPDAACAEEATAGSEPATVPTSGAVSSLWWESLPLTFSLAAAFAVRALFPTWPSGLAFGTAFGLGILICLAQNRLWPPVLIPILSSARTRGILALVVSILVFKTVIMASGTLEVFAGLARNPLFLVGLCIFLPLLAGLLTGVMMGFVGLVFPLLVVMLEAGGLWEVRLPWLTLAVMFGNIGQLVSPVHVCLLVTCRYFDAGTGRVWRQLCVPGLVMAAVALVWFAILLLWYPLPPGLRS